MPNSYLLHSNKEFYIVDYFDKIRPAKRNKVLSKWYREDINDFVLILETENKILFGDASCHMACWLM